MSGHKTEPLVWLPEDDALLLKLIQERKPVLEIARVMGRSRTSVYHRKHRLGQSDGRRPHPAYKDQALIDRITVMYNEGATYKQIMAETGLTKDMVSSLISKFIPVKRKKYQVRGVATYDEAVIERIRVMFVGEKMTQKAIAAELGMSSTRVRDICTSRGLKRSVHWMPEELAKMTEILKAGGSIEDIVAATGRPYNGVVNRAYKLNMQNVYPQVLAAFRHLNRPVSMDKLFEKKLSTNKRIAFRRGMEHSITLEDVKRLFAAQDGKCYYTGLPMSFAINDINQATIDRKESAIGYTKENIVLCTWAANLMKSDLDMDKFIELCGMIATTARSRLSP